MGCDMMLQRLDLYYVLGEYRVAIMMMLMIANVFKYVFLVHLFHYKYNTK